MKVSSYIQYIKYVKFFIQLLADRMETRIGQMFNGLSRNDSIEMLSRSRGRTHRLAITSKTLATTTDR